MSEPTPAAASSPKPGLPPVLANIKNDVLLWAQVAAGAAAFVFTFLPWVSVSYAGISDSSNGYDKGPWAVFGLLLGLVLAALGVITVRNLTIQGMPKLPAIMPSVLGGLLFLDAIFALFDYGGAVGDANDAVKNANNLANNLFSGLPGATGSVLNGYHAGLGAGIWLFFIVSIVAFGAPLVLFLKQRQPAVPAA